MESRASKSKLVVCHGAKYEKGISWHPELEYKLEPLGTQAYYAVDNCDGHGEILTRNLLNSVEHYKGNRGACAAASRCKRDCNYESSLIGIVSSKADELLRRSMLYRFADSFVLGKSTAHVESFNNTMLMFQDKRSYYSDKVYDIKDKCSVLHWNENVGREHTSVWGPQAHNACTRGAKNKKILVKKSYQYKGFNQLTLAM